MIRVAVGAMLGSSVAAQGGGAAAADLGTFPFAAGTIGFQTDWDFTGSASWHAGTSSILFNGSSGTATLKGAALTAFNAAISTTTAYDGEINVAGYVVDGIITANVRGSSDFAWEPGDNGSPGVAPGTSGSGTGLVLSITAGTPNFRVTTLTLTLA